MYAYCHSCESAQAGPTGTSEETLRNSEDEGSPPKQSMEAEHEQYEIPGISRCDSWCYHVSCNDNDHANIAMEGPRCRPDGYKLKRYKLKETHDIYSCVKISTSYFDWCQPCRPIVWT